MKAGLSLRAAARMVGCSPKAIRDAVAAGRIPLLPDGSVSQAAVDGWNAGRRAPRGGAHRTANPLSGLSLLAAFAEAPPELPDEAVSAAVAIDCGADELARIVARHLPTPRVRAIVAEWVQTMRRDLVGAAGEPLSPICVESDWPPPPGCRHWYEHELFAREPINNREWQEIEAEAAAWRAAHAAEDAL